MHNNNNNRNRTIFHEIYQKLNEFISFLKKANYQKQNIIAITMAHFFVVSYFELFHANNELLELIFQVIALVHRQSCRSLTHN